MTDITNAPLFDPNVAPTQPIADMSVPQQSVVAQEIPAPDGPTQPASIHVAPVQNIYVQPSAPVIIIQQPIRSKKGFGVASMVLGISAVIFAWTTVFAFVLLILAFTFGILSLVKKEAPRGFAITGIVLGSVAVIVVIIVVAIIAMIAGAAASVHPAGY